MRFRRLYWRLSYWTALFRDFRPGMQGVIHFSCKASRNQSAYRQAQCRAVRLQIGRVDHYRLAFASLGRDQTFHHPQKDALVTPPLPPIVERLVRSIDLRCIAPAQPVAVHEDDPAQNPAIINSGLTVAPRKIRLMPRHLFVRQPEQIIQIQSPQRA